MSFQGLSPLDPHRGSKADPWTPSVGDRKDDMWLYHIFKMIMLLFGFIIMFDTAMFLLSFDTDYIFWKHQAY